MTIQIDFTQLFVVTSPVSLYQSDSSQGFIYSGFFWVFGATTTEIAYLSRLNYKTGELVLFRLNKFVVPSFGDATIIGNGFYSQIVNSYYYKIPLPVGTYTANSINDISVLKSAYAGNSTGYFDSYNGIEEELLNNGGGSWVHNAQFLYSKTPSVVHQTINNSTLPVYAKFNGRTLSSYKQSLLTSLQFYIQTPDFSLVTDGYSGIIAAGLNQTAIYGASSPNSFGSGSGIVFLGIGGMQFFATNAAKTTPLIIFYCGGVSAFNAASVLDGDTIYCCIYEEPDFYVYSIPAGDFLSTYINPMTVKLTKGMVNHTRPISLIGKYKP